MEALTLKTQDPLVLFSFPPSPPRILRIDGERGKQKPEEPKSCLHSALR